MEGVQQLNGSHLYWAGFGVGVLFLIFSCIKIWRHSVKTRDLFLLLAFPSFLIVASMLAPRIEILRMGPSGFEFKLSMAQQAAIALVEYNPKIAEAISHKEGRAAIEDARQRILRTKSKEELNRIIPFVQTRNDLYFTPAIGETRIPISADYLMRYRFQRAMRKPEGGEG